MADWSFTGIPGPRRDSRSNATYRNRDFIDPNLLSQYETSSTESALVPSPLCVSYNHFGSHRTQPPRSPVVDNTRVMGGNSARNSMASIWEQGYGNLTPASFMDVDQSFTDVEASCYPPPGPASMMYGATVGYGQIPNVGGYDANMGAALSQQSAMKDASPVSSGPHLSPGEDWSSVSPFSVHADGSQMAGGSSGGASLSSSFEGPNQQMNLSIHQSHNVDTAWGNYAGPSSAHHKNRVATAGDGDRPMQEGPSDDHRCSVCGWAPDPKPGNTWRTDKQLRSSVAKHVHRKHDDPRRHPCPVENCSITFTRSDNVRPHVKREHKWFVMSPATSRRSSISTKRPSNIRRRVSSVV